MKTKCSCCNGTGKHIDDTGIESDCFFCSGYGFDCRNKDSIICPYCG